MNRIVEAIQNRGVPTAVSPSCFVVLHPHGTVQATKAIADAEGTYNTPPGWIHDPSRGPSHNSND